MKMLKYLILIGCILFLFISCISGRDNSVGSTGLDLPDSNDRVDANIVSFGLISDVHYNEPKYPFNLQSIISAVATWNKRANLSFAVELGDLTHEIDAATDAESQASAEAELLKFDGNVYGVIGNHELVYRTPEDYVSASSIIPSKYYSFDTNGIHFIVLYANDSPFYTVDSTQLTWLENDLANSSLPKIIFSHQRFDENYPGVNPSNPENPYCLSGSIPDVDCWSAFAHNADAVRAKLEADGNVLAVFSGHNHRHVRVVVNGIKYYTMLNAGSSASYAIIHLSSSKDIIVEGFGNQVSY